MTAKLSAANAACSIFGLEITLENQLSALQRLNDAGLEPVTLVNGDPTIAVAMSTKRVNMEPWRFQRLPQDTIHKQQEHDSNSSESFIVSIPPSRSAILDLVTKIIPFTSIPGITEECFLSETEVHDLISAYIPDDTVTSDDLSCWMSKDGSWGLAIRKQMNKKRKRCRLLNVVKKEYRDFTWEDLSNIQEYRSLVKSSIASMYTVGYARKSNTNEPNAAKEKLVNLQIYKLKTKLLCEDVFVSYNTSANDPIAERDVTAPTYAFEDCSGNTQDLITKITKSPRRVRLVIIDYAGLTTNPDDMKLFISLNKSIREVVVDVGHKVHVYSRHDLLKNVNILNKFRCRRECVKRSK
ncbi:hypothetical protein DFQ28_007651 [Apophysomyces sp. BC1034]|nr:hypothetical protein DFQ29_008289 [Apophysomyces sp. BC1021]KAG0174612.1 hypothetical protein DFQ30_003600 [Apophysomyces sp. BC1015]KAG0186536.1 hypothetical protein DFQ28_007651 [Apophysomyces sp. BC1034]